jgi:hypothetical protein
MAMWLGLVTRARYVGSTLRDRIPFAGRSRDKMDTPAAWDLSMFTSACCDVAANKELDARGKALVSRLLVDAEIQGYPVSLLTEPVEALAKIDWRGRYARGLTEVLDQVEKEWTRPTGLRRLVQGGLVFLADWVPPLALLAALLNLLEQVFDPWNRHTGTTIGWVHVALPLFVLLGVLVILQLLISILLPLRWTKIRDTFHRQLEGRVRQELEKVYLGVPTDLARKLADERTRVEKLVAEVHEVASWLQQREQNASIAGLYGH